MRIRIVRPTVCGGQPVQAGTVVDVEDREGEFLVQIGKAEIAREEPAPRVRRQRAVIEAPEKAILE